MKTILHHNHNNGTIEYTMSRTFHLEQYKNFSDDDIITTINLVYVVSIEHTALYVFMYVRMYVCMYVFVYVCIYVFIVDRDRHCCWEHLQRSCTKSACCIYHTTARCVDNS